MIPPERYHCLGELLRDALIQYKSETALLEFDRKREKASLRYLDVKRAGERLARRLQDAGVGAGDRVAIVMSNQSKWLISAYAALFRGAVLVPLDYKLSGEEQETLLRHCTPKVLITEYPEYRDMKAVQAGELSFAKVLVSEVPAKVTLDGAVEHWEDFGTKASGEQSEPRARSGRTRRGDPRDSLPRGEVLEKPSQQEDTAEEGPRPDFVMRARSDQATLVYSSGTGGSPKGCMLTHDNYLEQYRTLLELFPFEVGDRYFSILPTNHAIDFMVGFVGAFACGATVVHQRSLRPEFLRFVMQEKGVTHMTVVPLILEAFERRVRDTVDEKHEVVQQVFDRAVQLNAALTLKKPRRDLSRRLLKPVHDAIGPDLKRLIVGGAFVDPDRAQFFYDLGIPVVIGYGLTEACTVLTVNDLKPFRPDSVGRPLTGVELEIRGADAQGVGEVWAKSRTVFAGYLDDPEQTAEVLQDGWLKTGDLGWLDPSGHLHLVGRSKNMIVTAGGKNIYPEDIEIAFEGLDCEEFVVFASGYVWPGGLTEESLFAVLRPKEERSETVLSETVLSETVLSETVLSELRRRNHRLPDFKRIGGVLPWPEEFPRTASMKVKRSILAEQIRERAAQGDIQRVSL